jgi:hypothetical protein
MTRQSHIACVLIGLKVGDEFALLFMRHKKWKDWSLVGGHVEADEQGDWARTAVRETEEELPPLVHRRDFILLPLLDKPISWGPEKSKSAGGQPTNYTAQFFALKFLTNPVDLLRRLPKEELLLVPERLLHGKSSAVDTGRVFQEVKRALGGKLSSVPPAWDAPLSRQRLPIQLASQSVTLAH